MDTLTALGLFAVTMMLVTYALEKRSNWFVLAFCGFVRPRFRVRLPAGRLAVRSCRGYLVGHRRSALALDSVKLTIAHSLPQQPEPIGDHQQ
jgi:hypothetical protein